MVTMLPRLTLWLIACQISHLISLATFGQQAAPCSTFPTSLLLPPEATQQEATHANRQTDEPSQQKRHHWSRHRTPSPFRRSRQEQDPTNEGKSLSPLYFKKNAPAVIFSKP